MISDKTFLYKVGTLFENLERQTPKKLSFLFDGKVTKETELNLTHKKSKISKHHYSKGPLLKNTLKSMGMNRVPISERDLGGVAAKTRFWPDFEPGSREPSPLLYTWTSPPSCLQPSVPNNTAESV